MTNRFGILAFLLFCGPATLQAWDKYDAEALEKTKQLLTDPTIRNKAIEGDEKAVKADSFVDKTTGGDAKLKEDIYGLAATVMEKIAKDANGDTEKMNQMLNEFLANPSAFYSTWSPAEKERFKGVVRDIEEKKRSINSR